MPSRKECRLINSVKTCKTDKCWKRRIQRSHQEVNTIEPKKIIARKQRKTSQVFTTRLLNHKVRQAGNRKMLEWSLRHRCTCGNRKLLWWYHISGPRWCSDFKTLQMRKLHHWIKEELNSNIISARRILAGFMSKNKKNANFRKYCKIPK